jgi:hypothetical protein
MPRDAARGCARTSIKAHAPGAPLEPAPVAVPRPLSAALRQRRSSAELRIVRASPATRACACTKRERGVPLALLEACAVR